MGLFARKKKDKELDSLPELPDDSGSVGLSDVNQGMARENSIDSGLNGFGAGNSFQAGQTGQTGQGTLPDLPDLPADDLGNLPEPVVSKVPLMDDKVVGSNNLNHNGIQNEVQRSGFEVGGMAEPILAQPVLMSEHSGEDLSRPKVVGRPPRRKKGEGPIYIRLDKFQMTQDALDEIRGKIEDVEKILNKIKEIKEKEERELEEWERELGIMKSRIDGVDSSIFGDLK